jgi:hypothetical protein
VRKAWSAKKANPAEREFPQQIRNQLITEDKGINFTSGSSKNRKEVRTDNYFGGTTTPPNRLKKKKVVVAAGGENRLYGVPVELLYFVVPRSSTTYTEYYVVR